MNDEALAALARRHGLADSIVAEIRALSAPPTPADTWDPDASAHPAQIPSSGDTPIPDAHRYEHLADLGAGGMGLVTRVRDRWLNRVVAMKVIRQGLSPAAYARFVEEAQISAQLQHPGIIPLHDFGRRPDGAVWFTMDEVRGETLTRVIERVHAASGPDRWGVGDRGWNFRRLVDALRRVCEAVAFAHSRGVVHRDLKPDNVMVGEHGEVRVLDWGLAKLVGRPEPGGAIVSHRSQGGAELTRMGQVAGTPAFMPPEQARGEIDRIDARSDVYALGAMLYTVLSGHPPYRAATAAHVLEMVLREPPKPLLPEGEHAEGASARPLPTELVAACHRAMARNPVDRFSTASELAHELGSWLEGARLTEQARAVVTRALAHEPEAQRLRDQADALSREAAEHLADVHTWDSEEDKLPGWTLEDAAAALRRQADAEDLALERGLHAALRIDAGLPEAHAALAERHRVQHEAAEENRDRDQSVRAETLLQQHLRALPAAHPTRRACESYLQGDGRLSLKTSPAGAHVELRRYEVRHRRLVAVPVRSLGTTPLVDVALPMGSYLCIIEHPDCEPVRYPVEIARGGAWTGVAPGDEEPTPVWLPPKGSLAPDAEYVPAGWFQSGGDPWALNSHPSRRVWCHALVMQRFPVTNREFLAFLDDLVASGDLEGAMRFVPRAHSSTAGERGPMLYGLDGERFYLRADAEGDVWLPDWPALNVDWHGARAYLAWKREQTGHDWRLPAELEWEKAARGVDGRWFPWGDTADPSWSNVEGSQKGSPLPVPVHSYPVDVSPYGVRGMGGNMYDWCLGPFEGESVGPDGRVLTTVAVGDALRVARGGSWVSTHRSSRTAFRDWYLAGDRVNFLGFRGVYRPVED